MDHQEMEHRQAAEHYRNLRFRPGDYVCIRTPDQQHVSKPTVGLVQALDPVSAEPYIVVTEGGDVLYLDEADLAEAGTDAQVRCAEVEQQLRASHWSPEEENVLLQRCYGHDTTLDAAH